MQNKITLYKKMLIILFYWRISWQLLATSMARAYY